MNPKRNAADHDSAANQRDAGMASIWNDCSTKLKLVFLCDTLGDVC